MNTKFQADRVYRAMQILLLTIGFCSQFKIKLHESNPQQQSPVHLILTKPAFVFFISGPLYFFEFLLDFVLIKTLRISIYYTPLIDTFSLIKIPKFLFSFYFLEKWTHYVRDPLYIVVSLDP